MIFTNTQPRGPKPHLFLHHGQWWRMRPWQNEADEVYSTIAAKEDEMIRVELTPEELDNILCCIDMAINEYGDDDGSRNELREKLSELEKGGL